MAEKDEPEQINIMKQMLALAEQQTKLSTERTRMSGERTRMSGERSQMSEDRSRMSAERSRMSADRSEMSETRSYHNAERTLSAWVRTALSLTVLGIAMDRFGLLLHHVPGSKGYAHLHANEFLNNLSIWCGAALVLLGIFMALATGLRFAAYARGWQRNHRLPAHHGPYLAPFFAVMTALFGILVLVLMLVFTG